MNGSLEQFLLATENPYRYVAEWKQKNHKKVVGLHPMSIPEEMVHAAGVLPAVIWCSSDPITLGQAYAPTYHCGFTRSFIDDMVRGTLGFMDGMIFHDTCLVARGSHLAATRHNPPRYLKYIHLPPSIRGSVARDLFADTLEDLKASLEELTGERITEQSLWRSIQVYNENRSLLEKLYRLRRTKPGILKARETVAIVHSSMLMPKEEHNDLLKRLISELEKKAAPANKRVKLVLSGHFCYPPRADILDMIDELGGVVVDDEIFCGSRYFANPVKEAGNPISALFDRYSQKTPPDPTKVDTEGKWTDWGDSITGVVRRSGAQGVISLMVKFCPPHQEWHPDIKRVLSGAGVPELMLQTEREAVTLAPIRTRIEAFIESIRGAD